jgi:hypothetical protein
MTQQKHKVKRLEILPNLRPRPVSPGRTRLAPRMMTQSSSYWTRATTWGRTLTEIGTSTSREVSPPRSPRDETQKGSSTSRRTNTPSPRASVIPPCLPLRLSPPPSPTLATVRPRLDSPRPTSPPPYRAATLPLPDPPRQSQRLQIPRSLRRQQINLWPHWRRISEQRNLEPLDKGRQLTQIVLLLDHHGLVQNVAMTRISPGVTLEVQEGVIVARHRSLSPPR